MTSYLDIDGKVVLITGASEGIGAACVESFRRRGARLALTARNETKLRQVAAAEGFVVTGDLLRSEDRKQIVERTLEHYGCIDILINNAGVGLYSTAWQAPMPQVRELFELNLFAPLDMIQLAVPAMRAKRQGCIVNVGSIAGKITLPWFTLYSVSKYALGSLTDGLRMELRHDGIHAMTVCPGYVDTGFQSHVINGRPPAAMSSRRRFAITAHKCAEAIARGVERNARTVVVPKWGWLLVAAARTLPSFIDSRMAAMAKADRP